MRGERWVSDNSKARLMKMASSESCLLLLSKHQRLTSVNQIIKLNITAKTVAYMRLNASENRTHDKSFVLYLFFMCNLVQSTSNLR